MVLNDIDYRLAVVVSKQSSRRAKACTHERLRLRTLKMAATMTKWDSPDLAQRALGVLIIIDIA
jgi:hypothetical protein